VQPFVSIQVRSGVAERRSDTRVGESAGARRASSSPMRSVVVGAHVASDSYVVRSVKPVRQTDSKLCRLDDLRPLLVELHGVLLMRFPLAVFQVLALVVL
jgi:hypothetical protein